MYFVFLAMVALSSAAPACREALSRWDCAYLTGTVTSQAISLPRAQGIKVASSGRLASSRIIIFLYTVDRKNFEGEKVRVKTSMKWLISDVRL